MTATLDTVTASKKDKPEPTAEQKLAEELVARAREQGVALTGPDGLLKQLTKTVLETALNQEMTEHLGHDKHGLAGNEAGNVRNGTRPQISGSWWGARRVTWGSFVPVVLHNC